MRHYHCIRQGIRDTSPANRAGRPVFRYTPGMRKLLVVAALFLFTAVGHAQTADALWGDLTAGNARFVDGSLDYCALKQLRNATAGWQSPPTSILSCADSR